MAQVGSLDAWLPKSLPAAKISSPRSASRAAVSPFARACCEEPRHSTSSPVPIPKFHHYRGRGLSGDGSDEQPCWPIDDAMNDEFAATRLGAEGLATEPSVLYDTSALDTLPYAVGSPRSVRCSSTSPSLLVAALQAAEQEDLARRERGVLVTAAAPLPSQQLLGFPGPAAVPTAIPGRQARALAMSSGGAASLPERPAHGPVTLECLCTALSTPVTAQASSLALPGAALAKETDRGTSTLLDEDAMQAAAIAHAFTLSLEVALPPVVAPQRLPRQGQEGRCGVPQGEAAKGTTDDDSGCKRQLESPPWQVSRPVAEPWVLQLPAPVLTQASIRRGLYEGTVREGSSRNIWQYCEAGRASDRVVW